jgi:Bacterial archaeo-eukaryotic release factor family 2
MTTAAAPIPTPATRPPVPWQLPPQFLELADAGRVASAYIGSHDGVRSGADRVRSRWQGLRRWLGTQGAPEPMLSALDACTRQPLGRGETLAAFATADGRHHVEHLPSTLEADHAAIGPLPSVLPLLSARQRQVPMVVVTTRDGRAEMLLVEPGVPDLLCQVVGEDLLVSGAARGGDSWRRLEHAERARATNARAIAESLTWLVNSSQARLVVVDGDAGVWQLLRSLLEPRIGRLLFESRNSHGMRQLAARGRSLARDVAAADEQTVVAEVVAGLADGRACVGTAPTLRAVLAGQAEEVLVASEQVAGIRSTGPAAGHPRALHTGWAVTSSRAGRVPAMPDLLVHAATATSTVVRTVRNGQLLQGGMAALLRPPSSIEDRTPGRPQPVLGHLDAMGG